MADKVAHPVNRSDGGVGRLPGTMKNIKGPSQMQLHPWNKKGKKDK